jgi:transposase
MYPFYLGIDLHLKRTYAVLMDSKGKVLDERQIQNLDMKEYLKGKVPRETYAVLEATRNWPFMYDLVGEHVERVELAHPKELKAIASAAVKTDRIDARVLAHLARLNFLPTSYAAPQEIRDLRLYMRHREWLVRQRSQAKNRIHAVLAGYNLVSPMKDLFGERGRDFLAEALTETSPTARRVIADHLRLIEHLTDEIEAMEAEVQLNDEQRQTINLLKTMPGVGTINAIVILAEIGDISRFNSPKALCHWAGLTPRVRKSDQVVRHGRITKQGSPYLRAAMTRAATVASRCSPKWRQVHQSMIPRCSKKGAKVAVARRLLTVVYYMLKRQQPYQENYSQTGESALGHGSLKPSN